MVSKPQTQNNGRVKTQHKWGSCKAGCLGVFPPGRKFYKVWWCVTCWIDLVSLQVAYIMSEEFTTSSIRTECKINNFIHLKKTLTLEETNKPCCCFYIQTNQIIKIFTGINLINYWEVYRFPISCWCVYIVKDFSPILY